MKPITLKASHFNDSIIVFPSWVSSGRWAVRRDRVANAALFSTEAAIHAAFPKVRGVHVHDTDDRLAPIHASLPAEALHTFELTRWTYEIPSGVSCALLTSEHRMALIPRQQLALFTEDTHLFGIDSTTPFTDGIDVADRTFIVMPISEDARTWLRPLISLVHLMDLAADAVPNG